MYSFNNPNSTSMKLFKMFRAYIFFSINYKHHLFLANCLDVLRHNTAIINIWLKPT